MKTKPVVLIVDVPEPIGEVIPLALADLLSGILRLDGLEWSVRAGTNEMLALPAPPAETTAMSCGLWTDCRKHPAFGVDGLTSARADCPHFAVGGVLDPHKTHGISWATALAQIRAVVQGGLCVCLAYEPAEEPTREAQP
jgi:hypothetical protein